MASASEVYNKSTDALDTLSNIWQSMLQILQDVSTASASSLTVEPDLIKLQKARKDYEQLLHSLKATIEWLEANPLNEENLQIETAIYKSNLEEQTELQRESTRVNDQLKRLLNQSYALQFQIEMLFTSSQDIKLT